MKIVILFIGMCLLFLTIAYAVAAFATLEPNPCLWSIDIRTIVAIGGLFLGFLFACPIAICREVK